MQIDLMTQLAPPVAADAASGVGEGTSRGFEAVLDAAAASAATTQAAAETEPAVFPQEPEKTPETDPLTLALAALASGTPIGVILQQTGAPPGGADSPPEHVHVVGDADRIGTVQSQTVDAFSTARGGLKANQETAQTVSPSPDPSVDAGAHVQQGEFSERKIPAEATPLPALPVTQGVRTPADPSPQSASADALPPAIYEPVPADTGSKAPSAPAEAQKGEAQNGVYNSLEKAAALHSASTSAPRVSAPGGTQIRQIERIDTLEVSRAAAGAETPVRPQEAEQPSAAKIPVDVEGRRTAGGDAETTSPASEPVVAPFSDKAEQGEEAENSDLPVLRRRPSHRGPLELHTGSRTAVSATSAQAEQPAPSVLLRKQLHHETPEASSLTETAPHEAEENTTAQAVEAVQPPASLPRSGSAAQSSVLSAAAFETVRPAEHAASVEEEAPTAVVQAGAADRSEMHEPEAGLSERDGHAEQQHAETPVPHSAEQGAQTGRVLPHAAGTHITPAQPVHTAEPMLQGAASAGTDRSTVLSQVSAHLDGLTIRNGRSEVLLHLQPQELGRVEIRLSNHAGQIAAQFTAETEAAGAALESGRDNLRQSLEQRGYTLTALDVSVGGGQAGQGQFEKETPWVHRGVPASRPMQVTATVRSRVRPAQTGALDLVA
jgi:flagellar hook-length control protein FliK